jgi:hypothetical protein
MARGFILNSRGRKGGSSRPSSNNLQQKNNSFVSPTNCGVGQTPIGRKYPKQNKTKQNKTKQNKTKELVTSIFVFFV